MGRATTAVTPLCSVWLNEIVRIGWKAGWGGGCLAGIGRGWGWGCPKYLLSKLHKKKKKVHNIAHLCHHSVLHWLPIEQRVEYKICFDEAKGKHGA